MFSKSSVFQALQYSERTGLPLLYWALSLLWSIFLCKDLGSASVATKCSDRPMKELKRIKRKQALSVKTQSTTIHLLGITQKGRQYFIDHYKKKGNVLKEALISQHCLFRRGRRVRVGIKGGVYLK